MKTSVFLLSLLLCASSASAQPGQGAFTTLVTTNTGATSACIGCTIGGTTPADNSGLSAATVTLKSGAPSITTNKLYQVGGNLFFNGVGLAAGSSVSGTLGKIAKFTSATSLSDSIMSEAAGAVTTTGDAIITGIIRGTGFGFHGIQGSGVGTNDWFIQNTLAGTGNVARILVGNDTDQSLTVLQSASSTFASSGFTFASGSLLFSDGVGGLSIVTQAAAPIRFYTTAVERMRLHASGGLSIGNTVDPGATNLSVTGASVLANGVSVTNGLSVSSGGASITGTTALTGTLSVSSTTQLTGAVAIGGVNVTDAVAAPTITSNCGTSPSIAGRANAFTITIGNPAENTCIINLNTTYANLPVCVASSSSGAPMSTFSTSTSAMRIDAQNPGTFPFLASQKIYVICRGY
jgi:hypothetical protein